MCLDRISKRKIAKEDIVVYKMIIKEGEYFFTYFMNSQIYFNEIMSSELKEEVRSAFTFSYSSSSLRQIVEKGLHSFKYIPTTILFDSKALLVECVIPKGSEYYEGYFSEEKSLASNQLIYKRIIKSNVSCV